MNTILTSLSLQEKKMKDKPRKARRRCSHPAGPWQGDSDPGGPSKPVLPTVFHSPLSTVVAHHPFPIDPDPYETYNGDFRWIYGGEEREKRFGVKYTADLGKIYNLDYPKVI